MRDGCNCECPDVTGFRMHIPLFKGIEKLRKINGYFSLRNILNVVNRRTDKVVHHHRRVVYRQFVYCVEYHAHVVSNESPQGNPTEIMSTKVLHALAYALNRVFETTELGPCTT